ncbi:MAG: hypothetical protein R6U55_07000, partial [Desulfovermiculus sp.]
RVLPNDSMPKYGVVTRPLGSFLLTASAFSWILKLTADRLFLQLNCKFAHLPGLQQLFLLFSETRQGTLLKPA